MTLPREIQFRSGRVDCVSEYQGEWERFKTDRAEIHPNPEVSRYLDIISIISISICTG